MAFAVFLKPPAKRGMSIPLTTPDRIKTVLPISEALRRRSRIATSQPTVENPKRSLRPINVISMAAFNETREEGKKSLLSGTRAAVLAIVLHLFVAAVFFAVAEGWPFLDALYFAVVIATTVGYGDITPVKPISKLFVCIYAFVSVALIGGLLKSLVERVADSQRNFADNTTKRLLYSEPSSSPQRTETSDLISSTNKAAENARLRLRATIFMFVVVCMSGALLYRRFLNASFIDLIYFIAVSMTTVGLGDIHPITAIGKGFGTVWLIFTSLGFASILSQYADFRLKEKERDLAKRILSDDLSEKMFSEIDDNNDGTLSEAEFLGYLLCKLGKSTPDDVSCSSSQITTVLYLSIFSI